MIKLKQKPEDFKVKENMFFKPQSRGEYAYFIFTKKKWDTIKAVEKISNALNINIRRFSYSGLKDKNAVTSQYLCCRKLTLADIKRINRNLKLKDIQLKFIGFSDKAISLGCHKSNSFTTVVRGIKKPLSEIKYVCNYYDDQRFGWPRPINHIIGKEILKKNFKKAIRLYLAAHCKSENRNHADLRRQISEKWGKFDVFLPDYMRNEIRVIKFLRDNPDNFKGAFEILPRRLRLLFVNAFQAYVFNQVLDRYIALNFEESKIFTINYALGKLRCVDENFKVRVPLPGCDFTPENDIDEMVEKCLKKEKVPADLFGSIKTSFRYGCFGISNLKMSKPSSDDLNNNCLKQTVRFTVPAGSFATIVIKSLAGKTKLHKPHKNKKT